MSSLRDLLRFVPCRFRTGVMDVVRRAGRTTKTEAMLKEVHFLLSAQRHSKALDARYFPQSGKTERQVVEATAARVGFRMPKTVDADTSSGGGSNPPPGQ